MNIGRYIFHIGNTATTGGLGPKREKVNIFLAFVGEALVDTCGVQNSLLLSQLVLSG